MLQLVVKDKTIVNTSAQKNQKSNKLVNNTGISNVIDTASFCTSIWTQKYSPKSVKDLVIHSSKVKAITSWIQQSTELMNQKCQGDLTDVLLLAGNSGSCKSTTVEIICKELNIEIKMWSENDISLYSNSSFKSNASIFKANNQFEKSYAYGNKRSDGELFRNNYESKEAQIHSFALYSTYSSLSLMNTSSNVNPESKITISKSKKFKRKKDSDIMVESSKGQIVLILDPPIVTYASQNDKNNNDENGKIDEVKIDNELLGRIVASFDVPVIIILSDLNGREEIDNLCDRCISRAYRSSLNVATIYCGPITTRNIIKVLSHIADMEGLNRKTKYQAVLPSVIHNIANTCMGDLRHAIIQFEFVSAIYMLPVNSSLFVKSTDNHDTSYEIRSRDLLIENKKIKRSNRNDSNDNSNNTYANNAVSSATKDKTENNLIIEILDESSVDSSPNTVSKTDKKSKNVRTSKRLKSESHDGNTSYNKKGRFATIIESDDDDDESNNDILILNKSNTVKNDDSSSSCTPLNYEYETKKDDEVKITEVTEGVTDTKYSFLHGISKVLNLSLNNEGFITSNSISNNNKNSSKYKSSNMDDLYNENEIENKKNTTRNAKLNIDNVYYKKSIDPDLVFDSTELDSGLMIDFMQHNVISILINSHRIESMGSTSSGFTNGNTMDSMFMSESRTSDNIAANDNSALIANHNSKTIQSPPILCADDDMNQVSKALAYFSDVDLFAFKRYDTSVQLDRSQTFFPSKYVTSISSRLGCAVKGKGSTERIITGKQLGAAHIFQGIYRPNTINLNRDRNIFLEKLFVLRDALIQLKSNQVDITTSSARTTSSQLQSFSNFDHQHTRTLPVAHISTNFTYETNKLLDNQIQNSILRTNKQEMILFMIPYMKLMYDTEVGKSQHQYSQVSHSSSDSTKDANNGNNRILLSKLFDFPRQIELCLSQFFHKHKTNFGTHMLQSLNVSNGHGNPTLQLNKPQLELQSANADLGDDISEASSS